MLESHIQTPITIKRLRNGVAAPHIDEFASWMHSKGFKPIVIELRLRSFAAVVPPSLRRGKFKAPDKLIASLME